MDRAFMSVGSYLHDPVSPPIANRTLKQGAAVASLTTTHRQLFVALGLTYCLIHGAFQPDAHARDISVVNELPPSELSAAGGTNRANVEQGGRHNAAHVDQRGVANHVSATQSGEQNVLN